MKNDPSLEQTMYPILNNILLEKNTFKDTFGLLAFIASTGNLTIRDNTFINETPRKKPFDYRGNFNDTTSTNKKIENMNTLLNRQITTYNNLENTEMLRARATFTQNCTTCLKNMGMDATRAVKKLIISPDS